MSVGWTVENGIKPKDQICMKVILTYLFPQMRFKLILSSNNQNLSDYEVKYIKIIQTIFILEDTYKIWFRSWVQTKQFYTKTNKQMGKVTKRELLKQKTPICCTKSKNGIYVKFKWRMWE